MTGIKIFLLCLSITAKAQQITITYETKTLHQTIRHFGASDAWACQFAGNWPDAKKNEMADWLFSMDTLPDGCAKGIGLTMWRYNIGAGSAGQGDSSGIRDEWRRAAAFDAKDERIQGQNWFLQAAKQRGVQQFLAFFNSPPVHLTKNGKSFATKGQCNIDSTNYNAFAAYAVQAMKATGIRFNYISPVNEPQWDWSDGGQEGCPYNNQQIAGVVKAFNAVLVKQPSIVISESGHHKYLLRSTDKPDKENQIADFFTKGSANYIGNLPNVTQAIASHSYFSTSPADQAIALRKKIRDSIGKIEFWQSEYCILGDNAGEINGSRRDTGMAAALYMAKVIHYDLAIANASAWHWWLAISPYNYKDGLIYIDKNKTDGAYTDSKMLWALGNYSRFVRPGMRRITVNADERLLVSGYKDRKTVVLVIINPQPNDQPITLKNSKRVTIFTTAKNAKLAKQVVPADNLVIPAESIVTVIINQ